MRPPPEPLDPEDVALIAEAVDANYAQAPALRRLRYFVELFRGVRRPSANDLAARLAPWCGEGELAWLFDNDEDRMDGVKDNSNFQSLRHWEAWQ